MAKIDKIQEVPISELVPYQKNAKIHNDEQIQKIADSIEEFGFISPCLIDHNKNIIAGHGRVSAAKLIGMKSVPCLYVEGLTPEQYKAYILTDNKLTELGEWDLRLVNEELAELYDADFNIDLTGFEFSGSDWFENHEKWDGSRQEGNDEYNDFLQKFEDNKTTDDCYTPVNVYDAVAGWVSEEYNIKLENMIRPFYPGGDYQNEIYKKTDVVVDNPPFSIGSEIVNYYMDNGIKFFLFYPSLTPFSGGASRCTVVAVGATIIYENGANVNTSFVTNLEPNEIQLRTAPDLYKRIQTANDENLKLMHKDLPKYNYPNEVITAAIANRWSKYGVDYALKRNDCELIEALDSQKEKGKAIFGKGFLLSEKAAAEKAAAEKAAAEKAAAEKAAATVWELSERERDIIKTLGK